MAEEKKTKKKVEKEEVSVEKRFCTHCGKELKEGEECTCTNTSKEAVSINTDVLKNYGKSFINVIKNSLKEPQTTVKKEVEKKDTTNNLIMLAALAISFGLYITGAFGSIMAIFNSSLNSLSSSYNIDIPYFKIFLSVTIISFILAFVPILISYGIAKMSGSNKLEFKKAISLYSTSMAPQVISNLIMALLYSLNILTWIGVIIGLIINVACFFNYIIGYLDVTEIKENRKSYSLSAFVIVWVIVYVVVLILFIGNLISSVYKDVKITGNGYNYNINDLEDWFNW